MKDEFSFDEWKRLLEEPLEDDRPASICAAIVQNAINRMDKLSEVSKDPVIIAAQAKGMAHLAASMSTMLFHYLVAIPEKRLADLRNPDI